MAKIKVTKNLYKGRRIWFMFGLLWQQAMGCAVAYDNGNGKWTVRPVDFFLNWGDEAVRRYLKAGRFYTVKD